MQTNLSALEAFLDLPIWLIATIVSVPIAIVILLGVRISADRVEDRESADFGKEALAIVSGAFIFVGAFAVVTSWDNQTRFAASITNEFTSATSLAEDLGGIGDPRGKLISEALVELRTRGRKQRNWGKWRRRADPRSPESTRHNRSGRRNNRGNRVAHRTPNRQCLHTFGGVEGRAESAPYRAIAQLASHAHHLAHCIVTTRALRYFTLSTVQD